ncbi:hypothetical protein HDV00_007504 [Rhizophlyctis rosea]|nr:hypothetical protein HDV00_007504 [Rhizophlyctis rosea]
MFAMALIIALLVLGLPLLLPLLGTLASVAGSPGICTLWAVPLLLPLFAPLGVDTPVWTAMGLLFVAPLALLAPIAWAVRLWLAAFLASGGVALSLHCWWRRARSIGERVAMYLLSGVPLALVAFFHIGGWSSAILESGEMAFVLWWGSVLLGSVLSFHVAWHGVFVLSGLVRGVCTRWVRWFVGPKRGGCGTRRILHLDGCSEGGAGQVLVPLSDAQLLGVDVGSNQPIKRATTRGGHRLPTTVTPSGLSLGQEVGGRSTNLPVLSFGPDSATNPDPLVRHREMFGPEAAKISFSGNRNGAMRRSVSAEFRAVVPAVRDSDDPTAPSSVPAPGSRFDARPRFAQDSSEYNVLGNGNGIKWPSDHRLPNPRVLSSLASAGQDNKVVRISAPPSVPASRYLTAPVSRPATSAYTSSPGVVESPAPAESRLREDAGCNRATNLGLPRKEVGGVLRSLGDDGALVRGADFVSGFLPVSSIPADYLPSVTSSASLSTVPASSSSVEPSVPKSSSPAVVGPQQPSGEVEVVQPTVESDQDHGDIRQDFPALVTPPFVPGPFYAGPALLVPPPMEMCRKQKRTWKLVEVVKRRRLNSWMAGPNPIVQLPTTSAGDEAASNDASANASSSAPAPSGTPSTSAPSPPPHHPRDPTPPPTDPSSDGKDDDNDATPTTVPIRLSLASPLPPATATTTITAAAAAPAASTSTAPALGSTPFVSAEERRRKEKGKQRASDEPPRVTSYPASSSSSSSTPRPPPTPPPQPTPPAAPPAPRRTTRRRPITGTTSSSSSSSSSSSQPPTSLSAAAAAGRARLRADMLGRHVLESHRGVHEHECSPEEVDATLAHADHDALAAPQDSGRFRRESDRLWRRLQHFADSENCPYGPPAAPTGKKRTREDEGGGEKGKVCSFFVDPLAEGDERPAQRRRGTGRDPWNRDGGVYSLPSSSTTTTTTTPTTTTPAPRPTRPNQPLRLSLRGNGGPAAPPRRRPPQQQQQPPQQQAPTTPPTTSTPQHPPNAPARAAQRRRQQQQQQQQWLQAWDFSSPGDSHPPAAQQQHQQQLPAPAQPPQPAQQPPAQPPAPTTTSSSAAPQSQPPNRRRKAEEELTREEKRQAFKKRANRL